MRTPFAAVIGLLVSGSALAVVPSPAVADHTVVPDRVTLVGTLQSELGCAERLGPGLRGDPPRAGARDDVVRDGRRGAGRQLRVQGRARRLLGRSPTAPSGGAADIPLVLRHDATLTLLLRRRHAPGRRRAGRPPPTEVTDADRGAGRRRRCATPLTRERFYFVMADRFANGDPTNDTGGLTGGPAGDRLRPDRQGLLPRWRPRRADRASSTTSRAWAPPRSG